MLHCLQRLLGLEGLAYCVPFVFFEPMWISIAIENIKFYILLVSQAFGVVFLQNRLVFSKTPFIPLFQGIRVLILCNFAQNMYGFLALVFEQKSSEALLLHWLSVADIIVGSCSLGGPPTSAV